MFREICFSTADTLVESSFYLLIGFFFAGIVKAFVRTESIVRHIGKPNMISVVKAALIGTPLPLCSCSVLPMAASLNKSGASKGALVSFLVSTPESGFDSVAMSYAMLDPLMTVFRPIAAFVTAIVSGFFENSFFRKEKNAAVSGSPAVLKPVQESNDAHDQRGADKTPWQKIKSGLRYAFTDLLGDIAYYLLIGLVLSGIISAIIPRDFFAQYFQSEFLTMLVMLIVGIPMYVCASASTPIAAALILKGISPGAALVFLLSGPATNLATIAVVKQMLGTRSLFTYLFSISAVALLMGLLLNGVYDHFAIPVHVNMGSASEWIPDALKYISAAVFLPLLARGLWHEISHRRNK